jgi:hypothetical protein
MMNRVNRSLVLGGLLLSACSKPATTTQRAVQAPEQPWPQEQLTKMIAEAEQLVHKQPLRGEPRPAQIRERVLIWDLEEEQRSVANDKLPAARPADENLTLILIVKKHRKQVGVYTPGTRAYKLNLEIAAVDWLTKKVFDRAIVAGDDPPDTITGKMARRQDVYEVYGDHAWPLAKWVIEYPRQKD